MLDKIANWAKDNQQFLYGIGTGLGVAGLAVGGNRFVNSRKQRKLEAEMNAAAAHVENVTATKVAK